jgi:PAS domain S-box-containing protein
MEYSASQSTIHPIIISASTKTQNNDSSGNNKQKMHILHVDDDKSILEMSKQILEAENDFQVDTAASVAEAIERISRQKYEAIISDYEMPTKDGLQFLKDLREQFNETPFIMFTGKGREEVVIKALNLGADGYVNKQGDPETVYGELAHDIRTVVEKTRAEKALQDSEAKYSALIRQARDGVIIIQDQLLEFVNEALAKILGYSICEIEKKPFINFVAPESRDLIAQRVKARLAGLYVPSLYEAKLLGKDGNIVDVELSGTVIQYGCKPADLGIVRDITERKKAEEKIRISEGRYRNLFENARDIICTHDLEGKITSANKAVENNGFLRDEIIGRNILEIVSKDYWSKLTSQLSEIAQGKSIEGEIEIKTPLGKINVEYKSNPIWQQEKIIGAQTVIRDITERKRTEEELRKSEEKYRNIFELSPDGIVTATMNGAITSINKAFTDLTGFSEEEIVGKHFTKLGTLRARDFPEYAKILTSIVRGRKPEKFEFTFFRKDKTRRIGEANISVMKEKGKKIGIQAILRDITEYKKYARESIEQEHKLSVLLDSSLLAIWHCDLQGKVTLINREACERLKGKAEDFIGKKLEDIYDEKMSLMIRERMKKVKQSGENRICEDLVEVPSGEKWFRSVYNRIVDEEGIMVGLQILSDDITDKKKVERALRKTTEELRAESDKMRLLNEKLEVVGKLTRHDLRNKLAGMKGYVYLLSKKIGENAELNGYIAQINSTIASTERLLTFSNVYENIGSDQRRLMSVESCFNKSASIFPELQKLIVENKCQGLEVMADSQLEQLFYNLIDNSLRHGQKTNKITVTYKKKLNGVAIIYEDNGVGISKANKLKVFSEGFTTGKGSGYGLSLISKIVQVYGWTIKEEGKPGKGVRFVICVSKLSV